MMYNNNNNNSQGNSNILIDSKKKKVFYTLPFTGQSGYIIKKVLNNLKDDITFTFRKLNSLNFLFTRTKDLTPFDKNCDLVYCIPCGNCSQQYVGETLQHLEKRLRRHKYDQAKGNDETALAVHSKTSGHKFNFDETKILLFESNSRKRKIRKVIEIIKYNFVNFKSDSARVGSVYGSIFMDP